MHHINIEIAIGVPFTANNCTRSHNADRVDLGKDELDGRLQRGREWLR